MLLNLSARVARTIVRAMGWWTSLLRRLGILDLLPSSEEDVLVTAPELGLKPSDVSKASLFAGLLLALAIGIPISYLLYLSRGPGIASFSASLFITAAILVAKGPTSLLRMGAERFALDFQRGLAESFGRIYRALERGDEAALIDALRTSSPEVRRLLAEAQLSAGVGDRDLPEALAEEAGMWPSEVVRSFQMIHAALRSRKARESFAKALGRASLDILRMELESPLRSVLDRAKSVKGTLELVGVTTMALVFIISASPVIGMDVYYRLGGLRVSFWFLLLLLVSIVTAVRIYRRLASIDVDPRSSRPPAPSDLKKIFLVSLVLSVPAALLNPLFLAIPALIVLSYRLVGVTPLSSLALTELVNAIRTYSSLRGQGLNRLAAMDRTLTKVSHPEVRAWLQGARSSWLAQERDVLWSTVAREVSQYTGISSFLTSFDEADLNDNDEARESMVAVLEEAISGYSESSREIFDELASEVRSGLYTATILPLAGILMSWALTFFFGFRPDLSASLAILPIPISVILGFIRASRRSGDPDLPVVVVMDSVLVTLIYGITLLLTGTFA